MYKYQQQMTHEVTTTLFTQGFSFRTGSSVRVVNIESLALESIHIVINTINSTETKIKENLEKTHVVRRQLNKSADANDILRQ